MRSVKVFAENNREKSTFKPKSFAARERMRGTKAHLIDSESCVRRILDVTNE